MSPLKQRLYKKGCYITFGTCFLTTDILKTMSLVLIFMFSEMTDHYSDFWSFFCDNKSNCDCCVCKRTMEFQSNSIWNITTIKPLVGIQFVGLNPLERWPICFSDKDVVLCACTRGEAMMNLLIWPVPHNRIFLSIENNYYRYHYYYLSLSLYEFVFLRGKSTTTAMPGTDKQAFEINSIFIVLKIN